MFVRRVKVLEHERALVFKNGALEGVLQPGVHWMLDPLFRLKVQVVSIRNGWLVHPDVELASTPRAAAYRPNFQVSAGRTLLPARQRQAKARPRHIQSPIV